MRSMTRGPIFDVPMSRLAAWAARFAWFSLAVAVLSVIIVRSGLLEIVPALATFAAALIFAGLAILLALAAFVTIWRQGLSGIGRAVGALFLGVLLLAYPGYLSYRASKLPAINDVTTDTANPPRFGQLARLRPRGSNEYPGARAAALQHAAYPDIEPLQSRRRRRSPTRWRSPSSPSASGTSSTRQRRRPDGRAKSKRWRAR